MLAKLTRSLERKREGKTAVKYRFDVHVVKASGTFTGNPSLRVIWTRGSKVQMTDGVKVDAGIVRFDQALSQVATLYKDHKNAFESKVRRLEEDVFCMVLKGIHVQTTNDGPR